MWNRHCCRNRKRNWRHLLMKFQLILLILTLKMIKPNSILLAYMARGEICPIHSTEFKLQEVGCASISMSQIGKLSHRKYGGLNKHKIKFWKVRNWLGAAVLCTRYTAMTLRHSKRAITVSLFNHLSKHCAVKHTLSKASTNCLSMRASRQGSSLKVKSIQHRFWRANWCRERSLRLSTFSSSVERALPPQRR